MTGSRRLPTLILAIVANGWLAACSTTGPSAPPPSASRPLDAGSSASPASPGGSPSPTVSAGVASPAPTPSPPSAAPSPVLRLTSGAFADGAAIPRRYTCDGADVSPPLAWTGVPSAATAIVLLVDDPDASGFIHWVVFDLDAGPDGRLADGASSGGGLHQGTNGFGTVGWGGPCPPSGTHHYRFRLLAIRRAVGLSGAPKAAAVLARTSGQVVAEALLTGRYHR
jgi:Raf kinase inhibitor-like YbhB/YbcL family protein